MGGKFDYDESGDTTLFFLITVLSMYVVGATLSRLFGSKKSGAKPACAVLCFGVPR
jgi:hypothetical protein